MAAPEFVTLQVEDGVGTIRLDRPKMNAINEQLHREVRTAAHEAGEREDVRAVVLYGGERVFAAGADIKAMSQLDGVGMVAWGRELTASFTAVARIPKPVIAAITGFGIRATSLKESVSSRPQATMLSPVSSDIALMSAPAANTRSPP